MRQGDMPPPVPERVANPRIREDTYPHSARLFNPPSQWSSASTCTPSIMVSFFISGWLRLLAVVGSSRTEKQRSCCRMRHAFTATWAKATSRCLDGGETVKRFELRLRNNVRNLVNLRGILRSLLFPVTSSVCVHTRGAERRSLTSNSASQECPRCAILCFVLPGPFQICLCLPLTTLLVDHHIFVVSAQLLWPNLRTTS